MGRDAARRTLDRARGGDDAALVDLLAGVLAPTFDAACHLFRDATRAREATEAALVHLAATIRSGALEGDDPLACTGGRLARDAREGGFAPFPDGGNEPPPGGADLRTLRHVAALPETDRRLLILDLALGLPESGLATALGLPREEVALALGRIHGPPGTDLRTRLQELLDGHAAMFPLPRGLLDGIARRLGLPDDTDGGDGDDAPA